MFEDFVLETGPVTSANRYGPYAAHYDTHHKQCIERTVGATNNGECQALVAQYKGFKQL